MDIRLKRVEDKLSSSGLSDSDDDGHNNKKKFDFWNPFYQYTILLLVCYSNFSGFYIRESPAGLKEASVKDMEIDNTRYTLFFSATAWLNIIVCLFGGIVVDKVTGPRLAIVLVLIGTFIGHAVFTVGTFVNFFWITVVGRVIFGAANIVRNTVVLTILALWFPHSMSTAVALATACARFGGFVALALPSFIYESIRDDIDTPVYRLGAIHMIGVFLMVLSVVSGFLMAFLDRSGEKALGKVRQPKNRKFNCGEIKNFSLLYWLYMFAFSFMLPLLVSATVIGQGFFLTRYGVDIFLASVANSLIFGAVIITSPIIGYFIDRTGYNGVWGMAGAAAFLLSGVLLVVSPPHPSVPFIGSLGLSVSCAIVFPALLSTPAYFVQQNQLSTAFSLQKLLSGVVMSVMTAVAGVIIDERGYLLLWVVFILTSFIVMCLLGAGVVLEWWQGNGKVNVSPEERKKNMSADKKTDTPKPK